MKNARRRREPSVRLSAPRLLEALVKEPGKPARLTLVADTLEALQSIVDGPIEVTRLTAENVIVCNGEGMLRGLPRNARGICGTFLVLGAGDGESFGPVYDPRAVRAMLGDAKP